MVELIRSGEYTTSEVGDLFGVARSTVYRALQRSKQRAAVTTPAKATANKTMQVRAALQMGTPDPSAASYLTRHGASEFPPVKRTTRRSPRQHRPEPSAQTGR